MLTGARSKPEAKRIAVQKGETYFFPDSQVSIQATSPEEAEQKKEKEGSK